MGKQSKRLLDRAAKYIAKALESGAYTDTVGSDRFAEYVLEQIQRNQTKARPRLADEQHLLERAAKYIAKGLEKVAYTDTAGSDRFAEYILEQIHHNLAKAWLRSASRKAWREAVPRKCKDCRSRHHRPNSSVKSLKVFRRCPVTYASEVTGQPSLWNRLQRRSWRSAGAVIVGRGLCTVALDSRSAGHLG
jgi:hypothetical protein